MNGMLETIVRGASRIMLDHENAAFHKKTGPNNFVTDADLMVQEYLREKLHAWMPDSVFFSEEQDNPALTDAPTWVVDPIDGTFNMIRARKCSCISVALLKNREPVLGIVFNPYQDELFRAEKGAGALLNGHPIHVSQTAFDAALVNFGTSPYYPSLLDIGFRAAKAFMAEAGDLRRMGAAALEFCEVACGRTDVYFEMRLSPWDYAAGSLIVKEAGGRIAMPLRTHEDYGDAACILASNPSCFDRSRTIIQSAAAEIQL